MPGTDVRRGVGLLPTLRQRVEHLRAGRLGEQLELGEGVVGVLDGAVGPDADEHDPLEPELAVLDLADVVELGRQTRDPPQRVPLLELVVALDERVLAVGAPVGVNGVGLGERLSGGASSWSSGWGASMARRASSSNANSSGS